MGAAIAQAADTIKVGVLHSLSGTMAISETTLKDTVLMMVEDQNKETPFLQTGEDFEHSKTLNFIRDRLVEIHGEPKNLDYMHKLNNAIAFVEGMENKKADYAADAKGEQEKPKRTKVGYEKVELSLIDKIQTIQSGGRLYLNRSGSTWIDESDMKSWTIDALSGREFYSKVDIEITEREAFIEGAMEIAKREGTNNDRAWLGDIFNELISN